MISKSKDGKFNISEFKHSGMGVTIKNLKLCNRVR